MGFFSRGANAEVNQEAATGVNVVDPKLSLKVERMQYMLELEKQYKELSYVKYDANDPQQIVDTMSQLVIFINQCVLCERNQETRKFKVYAGAAFANLEIGIELLSAICPEHKLLKFFKRVLRNRNYAVAQASSAPNVRLGMLIAIFALILIAAAVVSVVAYGNFLAREGLL